jgi:hypothetical protein
VLQALCDPGDGFPGQQASREDTIVLGEGKDRAAMHFTDDVRRRGEAEVAAPAKLVLERACRCAAGAKRGVGARARV